MRKKLLPIKKKDAHNEDYMFQCPGCKNWHWIRVKGDKPNWKWNGSLEKPTFTPSHLTGGKDFKDMRCHSFITDGKIRFLNDCHHDLKGQTVELPDWEETEEVE
jgi:hypothetical protein